jgi:hypothetical protein
MPTKTNKNTETKELEVTPSLPLAVSDYTKTHPGAICVLLQPNAAKVDAMQPGLLGSVRVGEQTFHLACWWQQTRDGARDYYSMSITEEETRREALEEGEKPAPTARVKLYQFRQQDGRDPDYASPEPFELNGAHYWGLFWIVVPEDFPADPSEHDLQRVIHALIFSHTRPVEKWEKGLMRDMEEAQKFLRERRRELEARRVLHARRVKEVIEDDIP